jgi:1-acyl-sn-glycerol-3-phosphate acyltransferase
MKLFAPSESDPRARPKPFTFYPPKNNRFLTGLFKMGIRRAIRRKLHVTEIEISQDDLERLRQLKDQRCLVAPSHSGGFEPHIIMYLSKLLRRDYNYVAAMELFEQSPLYRWLMPRLGVYSIIRGAVDRPSFSMTRQLLAEGKRWLVIFPEGQTIWQNSTVIPFQQGVFQLAFKAYEDATKKGEDARLVCIPVAIKYVYLKEMHTEIDASLARLEAKLSLGEDTRQLTRYARLRRIGEAVLVAIEKSQLIAPNPSHDLDERIQNLKVHIVARIEHQLGVKPSERQTLLDRIRTLFNALDRIVHEEPPESDYEQQLAVERQQLARGLYEDLWRLLQFIAVQDGYVKESMTFERFMDVLSLLEMEVFKQRMIWGPRKAWVKVGEPIDLHDRARSYQADKRETIQEVTLALENSVRGMLEEMGSNCPLVDDSIAGP